LLIGGAKPGVDAGRLPVFAFFRTANARESFKTSRPAPTLQPHHLDI
jgi:hypothetical protein